MRGLSYETHFGRQDPMTAIPLSAACISGLGKELRAKTGALLFNDP